MIGNSVERIEHKPGKGLKMHCKNVGYHWTTVCGAPEEREESIGSASKEERGRACRERGQSM
eukprot:5299466-Lingulodinium_polyedra.AAC.1